MDIADSTPTVYGTSVPVLALMVSFVLLVWYVIKHALDGGRVRVYLNAAIMEPELRLIKNNTGKWQIRDQSISLRYIETAQLVIENPGRTAITVYNPGIAITGHGKRNHVVSPTPFRLKGFDADTATTANVVRIEPYDRVTFLLEYWSFTREAFKTARNSGIRLRGCISVAGRRRPQKSGWRLRWRIPQGAWTCQKGITEISPFTVMWQELYRLHPYATKKIKAKKKQVTPFHVADLALFEAMQEFESRPPREEFQRILAQKVEEFGAQPFSIATSSWVMYEALDAHEGHLSQWNRTNSGATG